MDTFVQGRDNVKKRKYFFSNEGRLNSEILRGNDRSNNAFEVRKCGRL